MSQIFKGIKLRELGNGIYEAEELINARSITLDGKTLHRFLDRLWLPSPTPKLNQSQVNIINRFRERQYADDPQFIFHHDYVAKVAAYITHMGYKSILEIGCGRFPISDKLDPSLRYQCIESDMECITQNEALHKSTHSIVEAEALIGQVTFDCFVSLFVFQFSIEKRIFDAIGALVPDGDGIFNVPTHCTTLRSSRVKQITQRGFKCIQIPYEEEQSGNYDLFLATRGEANNVNEIWQVAQK